MSVCGIGQVALGASNQHDLNIQLLDSNRAVLIDAKLTAQNSDGSAVTAAPQEDGSYLLNNLSEKVTIDLAHPAYGDAAVQMRFLTPSAQVTMYWDAVTGEVSVQSRETSGPAALTTLGGGPAGPGGPVDCSTGVGCQLPDQQGHGASGTLAATSDLNPGAGFQVADTFNSPTGGAISSLCWWGIYINFSAPNLLCVPDDGDSPDAFSVVYYNDGGGVPGSVHAGPFPLLLSAKFATGNVLVAGSIVINEYQFEAAHGPVLVSPDTCYWISIYNSTTGACYWLWDTAPPGDGYSAQDNNGWGVGDYDLAWCMNIAVTADGCGAPPPPGVCGDPASGSCFEPNGTPGCDDEECCSIVCAIDPFCCDVAWDSICVAEAFDLCPGAPTTGACCFPDGSCQDLDEGDCAAAGGAFEGVGTECATTFCPIAPPNDLCANALPIFDGDTPYDTTGAGTDGQPGAGCQFDGQTYNDIWYDYVATCTGELTVSTCNQASYDTDLAVYDGCDCNSLVLLGCNDDAVGCSGFTSEVVVPVVAGNCYKIRIGGWQDGNFGPGTVTIDCFSIEPVGACCIDGECVDNVLESECLAANGDLDEFYPGEQCAGGFLGYEVADCGNAFEDISGTGIEAPNASNSDDNGDVVPLGFTFNFYGDNHTEIGIASNGYLTFGSDLSDFTNDAIPSTTDPNDLIAPYWDDWSPNNGGTVHYQTLGTAPNRRFIGQWTNVPIFGGGANATFQAVLYEGSNCIEFRYGTPLDLVSPTIGIENQDGTDGVDASPAASGDCISICPVFTDPIECEPPFIELPLDIKPGSCPNSFNRNSNGVLPVALLGTMDFDIMMVDISSIQISRADGVGGSVGPNEGPPGPHSVYEDVATPFYGEGCECHEMEGDGIMDLSMKFNTQEVVDALELDDLPPGDLVQLCVTGMTMDGTQIVAYDCIRLVPPGTPPGYLSILRNPATNFISIVPLDNQLDGGGYGEFVRDWPIGSLITLTAPAVHNGQPLVGWRWNGLPLRKYGISGTPMDSYSITIILMYDVQDVEPVYAPVSGPGPSAGR